MPIKLTLLANCWRWVLPDCVSSVALVADVRRVSGGLQSERWAGGVAMPSRFPQEVSRARPSLSSRSFAPHTCWGLLKSKKTAVFVPQELKKVDGLHHLFIIHSCHAGFFKLGLEWTVQGAELVLRPLGGSDTQLYPEDLIYLPATSLCAKWV